MPWFNAPLAGATTGVDVFFQSIVDAFVGWKGQVNANNNNLANLNILQAREVRIMGIPVSPVTYSSIPCSPTANPLVWTFMASHLQHILVAFDNVITTSGYTITGIDSVPLLVNPGFESDFTSWILTGTCSISTVNPNSGLKCAKISSTGAYIEQVINSLIIGSVIQASCYIRGDVGTTATAEFVTQDTTGGSRLVTTFPVTPTWALINMLYTVTPLGNLGLALQRSVAGLGDIYADNFSISGTLVPTLRTITFSAGNGPIDDEIVTAVGGLY